GSPAPGVIPSDGFSVRWSRSLNFAPGAYRFVLTAQDGGRLLVEGQPVIDAWQGAAGQTITADQALSGGQYQVVVQFRNLAGPARIAIGWSPLPTPTPVLVAGVDLTPTFDVVPTLPPATAPTNGPPTATPTLENGTPGATETALPTSSVTASATETNVTPNGSATPETTPGTPTATPDGSTATPTATATPLTPPGSAPRTIDINPTVGQPGEQIQVTSSRWPPATVLRVSLSELNTSYLQAVPLDGVSFTTPVDSLQDWSFRFIYPNQLPWSNPTLPVYVWVHNADWSEWSREIFDIVRP
ncbi:MAG TPA: PA14 domain-containing protein, partial [Anaerolineae bacterium]|nr:PA14 domain-containing protein [Anaerolineae bacterium]